MTDATPSRTAQATEAPPRVSPLARLPASDDLRRRLVVLTLLRLAVATMLLGLTLGLELAGRGDWTVGRAMVGVVVGIYLVSVGYALALARGANLRALAWVQIGLDLAAWSAIVYVTGGPSSPMSFFFVLSPLVAALLLGAREARTTAAVAVAAYGALVSAMTAGLLVPLPEASPRPPLTPPELTFQIMINVVGTLAVASLGGALATRVSRAGGALARVEASRAALTALYEDVLRSIPVALLTCQPDGTIDGANPGAAQLLGAPAAALLGTPVTRWLPFIPPDAFAARQPPRLGDETLGADGGGGGPPRRVAYRAAPLYDRDGDARGGLVVIEDRSSLEALREAVQRAERLAEVGRLAAALAHEIRNPLGAISGCVELVRETAALEREDRDLLATVLREVARLNSLVTDMLAFARPRPPTRADVDLAALAREVATLADTPGAGSSGARVVLARTEPDVVRARVDAGQVRQVLWNLVRNAVQASPEDATVEVAVTAAAGGATLSVADRGRGLPPAERERLFDRFYADDARGAGLGLAVVRQIVDAHGARIDVRDRPGGGTEIAVTFPLDAPEAPAAG